MTNPDRQFRIIQNAAYPASTDCVLLTNSRSADMSERKFIPIEELAAEWEKNPEFVAAYESFAEEFRAYRNTLIKERDADLSSDKAETAHD